MNTLDRAERAFGEDRLHPRRNGAEYRATSKNAQVFADRTETPLPYDHEPQSVVVTRLGNSISRKPGHQQETEEKRMKHPGRIAGWIGNRTCAKARRGPIQVLMRYGRLGALRCKSDAAK